MFSNDRPIDNLEDDYLGREKFVIKFSEAIIKSDSSESLVLSLNGSWGSGKTSLINLIKQNLNSNYKDKITIINFNPWYYTDRTNLILKFFEILCGSESFIKDSKKRKKLYDAIGDYAANFESISSWIPYASGGIKAIKEASKQISKKYDSKLTNVEEQLNKIRDIFSNLEKRILVIIDDIDRLNENEIRDIFQLVKLVADIPNVVYLLSFDKEVVTLALNKLQQNKGNEYLEKIVQVPFEIPIHTKFALEQFLFREIDKIIDSVPQQRFETNRWGELYREGLKEYFKTPRQINRFINVFSFDFELVKDDVNIVDLLGITFIKVFETKLFDIIKNNKIALLKITESDRYSAARILGFDQDRINYKSYLDGIFNALQLNDRIKNIVRILFPNTNVIFGDAYSSEYAEEKSKYRKMQRICSEENFETYFMLNVPTDILSNYEMEAILKLNNEDFKNKIIQLRNENRISPFLDRLEDYTGDIVIADIQKFIDTLYDLADTFDENKNVSWLYSTELRITRITYQLITKIEDKKLRYNVIKEAIENSQNSLFLPIEIIAHNDSQHGKFERPEQKVSVEKQWLLIDDVNKLDSIGKEKIEKWWKEGKLLNAKRALFILYRWKEWGGDQEINLFIQENTNTTKQIAKFLIIFLRGVSSQSNKGIEESYHYEFHYKDLKRFVDVETIYSKVKDLNKKDMAELDELEKETVKLFIDYHDDKVDLWMRRD